MPRPTETLHNQNDEITNLSMCGKIPVNPEVSTVFHTSRLCQRLSQQKGDFDLTDPNGYKLSSLYNCLHDPNLKTYMHRKDIHSHLLTYGYITKNDKVICSLREFNRYRNYLAEVQLDWDYRFKAEQKELVRMLLLMQQEGKLASDISIMDVMESMLFKGSRVFTQELLKARDRSERLEGKGDCSGIKLPKIKTQTFVSDSSESKKFQSRSEKVWKSKGRSMLKEVIADVQREMRLEKWKSKVAKKEQDTKKQRLQTRLMASKQQRMQGLLEPITAMKGSLIYERKAIMQEAKSKPVTKVKHLVERPTLTKLKPLPKMKKLDGLGDNVIGARSKLIKKASFPPPSDNKSCQKVPQTEPTLSLLAISGSESDKDTSGYSRGPIHTIQQHSKNEVKPLEDHLKKCISSDDLSSILGNIVSLVVKKVNGILIPAMQSFEGRDATKTNVTPIEKSTLYDFHQCEHPESLCMDCVVESSHRVPSPSHPQSEGQGLEYLTGGQEDRRSPTSPNNPTSEVLNPGLIKKAESIIWDVIWKSVNGFVVERNCTEQTSTESEECQYSYVKEDDLENLGDLKAMSPLAAPTAEGCIGIFHAQAQVKPESSNDSDSSYRETGPGQNKCPIKTSKTNLLSSELVEDMLARVCSLIVKDGGEVISNVDSDASFQSSSWPSTAYLVDARTTSEALCCVALGQKRQIVRAGEDGDFGNKLLGGQASSVHASPSQASRVELSRSEIGPYAHKIVNKILHSTEDDTAMDTNETVSESPNYAAIGEQRGKLIPVQSEKWEIQTRATSQPSRADFLVTDYQWQMAARVSHSVFEKIKGHFSISRQGHVKSGMDTEVADLLVLEVIETALEKLEDITAKEKLTDFSIKEDRTGDPVSASELHSSCKTVRCSGPNEMCFKSPPQASSSQPFLTDSCGSQPNTVSEEIVVKDVCEVDATQVCLCYSTEQAGSVSDTETVVEDILKVLNAQGTPITQYKPVTFDHVSTSISQTLFKHTSQTPPHSDSEVPPELLLICSPIPCASTAELDKSTGTLSKLSTSQKINGGRGMKMKKKCRSQVSASDSPMIRSHILDKDTVLHRVEVEMSSSAKGDRKDCKQDIKCPGVCLFEPQTRENVSNNALNSKPVTSTNDASYIQTRHVCKDGDLKEMLSSPSMLLLQSTVEKLVMKLVDQKLELEKRVQQESQLCDRFQSSDEKITTSRDKSLPYLCKVVTQSVMDYLQLDHSSYAPTGNTDVGPIMLSKVSMRPVPPWSGTALKSPLREPTPSNKTSLSTEHWHHKTMEQVKSVFKPFESSSEERPTEACKKREWFYAMEDQLKARQKTPSPGLSNCLEYLHTLPVETLENIVSYLIVNIYSDDQNIPCTTNPALSDTAVDLIDDVLVELRSTPTEMPSEYRDEPLVMPESCTFDVAQSVHKELLRYSGSQESLRKAVSTSKDQMVKKIASSISLEVSKVASMRSTVNHNVSPSSPPPRVDTNASLLSCPASDLSEEIVLRILDLMLFCRSQESMCTGQHSSTDLSRDLMSAVMVELMTNPVMLTLHVTEQQKWCQPSHADLDNAARQVYQDMVELNGSVKALESALRFRSKLVVTALANAVATKVYQLLSNKGSRSTTVPDQAIDPDDSHVAASSWSLSRSKIAAYPSISECVVNCKATWEIIFTLLQELCSNVSMEAQVSHYAHELFHSAVNRLSAYEEVKVCWDKTMCDVCHHPQAVDHITSRALQRTSEKLGFRVCLGPALDAQDKAVIQCIVDFVVEETLLFMSQHSDISTPVGVSKSHHGPEDDTPPSAKVNEDLRKKPPTNQSKSLLSTIKGFFGFCTTKTVSKVASVVFPIRNGPGVLSVKVKKHSPRGRFITPEERSRRLKEQQMRRDAEMSDPSGLTSEWQHDEHQRGRFGWILSKLICADDIYWMDCT